jgi:protein-disulfide isomerase
MRSRHRPHRGLARESLKTPVNEDMNAYSDPRQSKNEKRLEAREKARELREKQSRSDKRKKVVIQSSIAVAVVAIIAIVAYFITSSVPDAAAGPRNMQSDGIKIGKNFVAERTAGLEPGEAPIVSAENPSGVAEINVFVDYSCPHCGDFEEVYGEQFRAWVEEGTVTVEYHPLSFLDPQTAGQRYSTRAANVAACVADIDPDSFFGVNEALLLNQPARSGTVSYSDADLVAIAESAGVSNISDVESCISDERFVGWVEEATVRAMGTGPVTVRNSEIPVVQGTPTVLVNGKSYAGTSPADLAAFVTSIVDGAGAE